MKVRHQAARDRQQTNYPHPIDSVTPHRSHAKIRVTSNLSCLLYTFRVYFTLRRSLFWLFESTLHSYSLRVYFTLAGSLFSLGKWNCGMEILQTVLRIEYDTLYCLYLGAQHAVACFLRVFYYLLLTEPLVVAKSLRPERMIPLLQA